MDFIASQRPSSDSVLAKRIQASIEAEYRDKNLTIATIGEQFGMAPYYLSRVYKDALGLGILDSIAKCRIEGAKERLIQTGDSIQLVAEAVGFTDVNTFIRVFKKLETITPGKFRELYREKHET